MRLLRRAAGLLARLAADLLLVLAALTILLWIATRNRPLSIGHTAASRDGHWEVSLRVAAARGGLWVLHLSTRPPDMAVPLGLGAPHVWSVQATDAYDPDARLTPAQAGHRRSGFSTTRRQAPDRTYAGVDPRTGGRAHYVFREQERITRIPFAAIVGALLTLPAVRVTLAIRHRLARRPRDPSAAPCPTFPVLRRCADLAALAATLPLAFAVYQWIATRHDTNALSWSTQPLPSPVSASGEQVRRSVDWSPDGWRFTRSAAAPVGPVTYPPPATTFTHTIGLNIRDNPSGGPLPSYLTVGATSGSVRHLGFAYDWHDTPMGSPTYYVPPPQVRRSPSGAPVVVRPAPVITPPAVATSRRIGASLLIPHWAVVLVLAIPPAFAALRFRAPLRRHRRLRRGLCPDCGYDLRGTPDRCPECGHAATVTRTFPRPA